MEELNVTRLWALTGLLAVGLPGCRDDGSSSAEESSTGATDDDSGDAGASELEPLSPSKHLVRISTALRGQRPSISDLDRVEADPDALAEIVDEYMRSPEFGEVVRDLHNDALLVDTEVFELEAVGELEGEATDQITTSVLTGPLRLIEHVIANELPYTDIVTADYWVVDHRSSVVWGTQYDPAGPEWQPVPIPDDRPAAGILTDNAFYVRHLSCGFNYNRGRANALSQALLCHDYLTSDIAIDGSIDLSDPDAVSSAVQEVAACKGCHQTLDPLATMMLPYLETAIPDPPYDYPLQDTYAPDGDLFWAETTGRKGAYFGVPLTGMDELGGAIAADPRFSLCTATRFYSYFAQVRLDDVPLEIASDLQIVFEESGFDAKTLIREIMLSEEFGAASANDPTRAEDFAGYKRVRPFQLANLLVQLTGYEWNLDISQLAPEEPKTSLSLARNSFLGFEVLAGGHDSFFQTEATSTVNATTSLFLRKMANDAASYGVERDFAVDRDSRRLLWLVEADEVGEAAIRSQLAWLFRRIYGEKPASDDASIDDAWAIFSAVHARTGDTQTAWKATLSALLQDINVLYY